MKITLRLVNRLLPQGADFNDPAVREKIAYFETGLSTLINLLLFPVKLWFGMVVGSIAILADAFHTFSDVLSSVMIGLGFKLSAKAPDLEHPFGHGRIEYITGILVAVLLVLTGVEFFKASLNRILEPRVIPMNVGILAGLALTIVLKEFTARLAKDLGSLIQSPTLTADAWHHRSDVLSTLIVLLGV